MSDRRLDKHWVYGVAPMVVSILGKRWKFGFVPMLKCVDGVCDSPDTESKGIRINQQLRDETLLETILHECLHAADWTKDEEFIEREARDIARILWRLGYRKQSK